jgi:hypothetical protein
MPPGEAAAMVERLTAAEATAQIIGLINSRPATPWPHEIEAIIARANHVSGTSQALPADVVAYRAKTQEFYRHSKQVMGPLTFDAPNHDVEYERNAELGRQADVAGDVLLNTPPTTWGNLVGLASIVAHEAGHDLDALGPRRTKDGDPGPQAAELLALAVLRLYANAVPQIIPVDPELVRLISAWRRQRDIVDGTISKTHGRGLSCEDYKPYEETIGNATSAACDLAQQIWERAKAETWSGGPVNPLTLAVLAEIVLHHENGSTNTLEGPGDHCMDEKAAVELMVAVLSHVRSVGAGSDLLPMEGRFLPPALLKGGRAHE